MSAPIRSSPDNLIGTTLRVLYGMRYDQGRGPLFALVSDDLAAFWGPTSADPHTRPDRPLIRPTPVLLEGDQRIAIRQAPF